MVFQQKYQSRELVALSLLIKIIKVFHYLVSVSLSINNSVLVKSRIIEDILCIRNYREFVTIVHQTCLCVYICIYNFIITPFTFYSFFPPNKNTILVFYLCFNNEMTFFFMKRHEIEWIFPLNSFLLNSQIKK